MAIERNSIGDECYWEDLGTVLAKFRARRRQRYSLVGVLLLYWLDSDLDSAGDASELENLFKNDFNYEVNSFGIPTEGSYEELRSYVVSFLERFDRQGNLAVVHYGGHGGRPDSRKSPTTWFA
jgi:Caspase domain